MKSVSRRLALLTDVIAVQALLDIFVMLVSCLYVSIFFYKKCNLLKVYKLKNELDYSCRLNYHFTSTIEILRSIVHSTLPMIKKQCLS